MDRANRKTRIGTIVSDKMEKTIVVAVESHYKHPLYNKILKRIKKYKAHDSKQDGKLGDVVKITETRPLSKTKRWRLEEVDKKAE